jgi:hypothetical protein
MDTSKLQQLVPTSSIFRVTTIPGFTLTRTPTKTSPQEPDFGPEKANRDYNCAWRDFFAEMPSTMPTATEWIDLEEGQFYPISGYLREGNG